MKTSITAGPMARAASVLGAAAPTARPSAAAENDSSVRMPRKRANLELGSWTGITQVLKGVVRHRTRRCGAAGKRCHKRMVKKSTAGISILSVYLKCI